MKITDWGNDCWIEVKLGKIRTKEDSYQGQLSIDIHNNDSFGLGLNNVTKLNLNNAKELLKQLQECINEIETKKQVL